MVLAKGFSNYVDVDCMVLLGCCCCCFRAMATNRSHKPWCGPVRASRVRQLSRLPEGGVGEAGCQQVQVTNNGYSFIYGDFV